MQTALLASSFLLGLLSGSHCLAMCGPACVALQAQPNDAQVMFDARSPQVATSRKLGLKRLFAPSILRFQLGRLLSYSAMGAVVAASVQALAWGSASMEGLKSIWTIWHALVLVWGLILLLWGRQVLWLQGPAQKIWGKLKQTLARHNSLYVGLAWVFLPCGLLYAALLQASLTANALQGAAAMALFALGSSLWLLAAPAVWQYLQGFKDQWAQRLAGLFLLLAASFSIWQQFQPGGLYC